MKEIREIAEYTLNALKKGRGRSRPVHCIHR